MKDLYTVLEKPLVTEKSTEMQQHGNWVTFVVNPRANKVEIKAAVEKIFNVTVLNVNTTRVRGKNRRFGRNIGRTKDWKKAMLLLKEGDRIELFEGA